MSRILAELAPVPFAKLSERDKLARLWGMLPGLIASTARREGVTPQRVLEVLADRLPDDEEWFGFLADYDAETTGPLADLYAIIDMTTEV